MKPALIAIALWLAVASPVVAQLIFEDAANVFVRADGGDPITVGSVTSVGWTGPPELNCSGSPIVTDGVINCARANQTAFRTFAAPLTDGVPTFRLINHEGYFAAAGGAVGDVLKIDADGFTTIWGTGGGGGAPTGATYITQTADATLTAEQAMGALGTGMVINTTTTGVQSIYAGANCTNQFPRSLSASGAATCATVTAADTSGIVATTRTLTAGTGLVGGGDLSANRTFSCPTCVRVLSNNAPVTINNTVTETTIFTYSIPGNTLGANGMVEWKTNAGFLNNNAALTAVAFTVTFKWNGVVVYGDAISSQSVDADERAVEMTWRMTNAGATNSQHGQGTLMVGNGAAGGSGGIGNLTTAASVTDRTMSVASLPAVDTTAAVVFDVTIILGLADVATTFRTYHSSLTLYP